jgi:gamma-glutamyl:cysteine ligase YbdK (ATP-grasp superfamily)
MGIYFEGIASRGDYQSLLQTLTYECSQNATMASLHVKLKVGSKNKTYTLLDEVIDTLGNTK